MSPKTPEQNEAIREQTREQIKESAFNLFAQKGFGNTSVSSIAKEAGISKGLIYHYFQSKKEILKALFDDLISLGDQAMDFSPELSPAESLEQMLKMTFKFMRQQKETMRLLTSLALQPDVISELKPIIEEHNNRQLETIAELLRELGHEDPVTEAYFLGAKLDGIALGYITLEDDYPFNAIKQKILDEYVNETENH